MGFSAALCLQRMRMTFQEGRTIPGCAGPAAETPKRLLRIQQARYVLLPPSLYFDVLAVMTISGA